MIEVRLLGLHAIRGADGRELSALPAQPKRFALLAYLVIGGAGGYHRRDSLAATFWPDLDQFAARRALRNTLYHLREALGDGAIIVRGDDAVSIDPTVLTCDATMLGEALAAGRYEDAVEYYRGELLAGVHFANAGDAFEEWLSRERRRVTDEVMRAIRALVDREEKAGNIAGAAYWAQRGCALVPDDEGWLRRGMSLLERASDTGGALRLYETYAHRLVVEFDATPSAETQALAARIREGVRNPPSRAETAPPAAPGSGAIREAPSASPAVPPEPRVETAAAPDARASGGHRGARARRAAVWVAGLAAAVVLGVLAARDIYGGRSSAGTAPARVLIMVFDNRTGDPGLQALGRMTQDWLAQGIVRTHVAAVVDPRAVFVQNRTAARNVPDPITLAHRTGAAVVVTGSYYRTGDTLLVQAAIVDVGTQRIVRVVGPIRSDVRAPVAALDALRSRVMTALVSAIDVRATQSLGDEDEIPPFEAYEPYVEGYDAYWHGDGRRAEALFLQAARRDTAFAAASVAAAQVAANYGACPLTDSIARALEARPHALDRVQQLSLRIETARCHGRNEEMLRLALERADLEPHNSSDQMAAAAAALWANRPQRTVELLERVNPAIDLAWNTDTTHFDYFSNLTEALHLLGDHREELADAARVPRGAPLARAWMRARALAALSRPTAALAVLDSAFALPAETSSYLGLAAYTDGRPQYTATPLWVAVWIAREFAVHGDTVAARQAATRAIAWYRGRPVDERSTLEERLYASWALEMLGTYPEAERLLRQLIAEDSTNVDFRGELAGLAAQRGDTALADSLDRWLAAQPVARVGWSASVYRARVAALLGRLDSAVARTREARDAGAWPYWIHADPALAPLRGRADFVALTAPRD